MRLVRDTFVLLMLLVLTASTFQGPAGWENDGLFPWEDPDRLLLSPAQIEELSFIIQSLPLLEDARITFKHLFTPASPSSFQSIQLVQRLDDPGIVRFLSGYGESEFMAYYETRDPLPISTFTRTWDETNLMLTTASDIATMIGSFPVDVTTALSSVHIIFGFGSSTFEEGVLTLYVYTLDIYRTLSAIEEVLFDLLLQDYIEQNPVFPEFAWVQAIIDDGSYVSKRASESDLLDRAESLMTYYGIQTNPERYSAELLQESRERIDNRSPLLQTLTLQFPIDATTTAEMLPLTTPYTSTIYEFADLITFEDPSLFEFIQLTGSGIQNVYDRRLDAYEDLPGFFFTSTYKGGKTIEVFVNQEFLTETIATSVATYYSRLLGQLPFTFVHSMDRIWIHLGQAQLGGGNRTLVIHTDKAGTFERRGILEEVIMHEVSHTLFDFELDPVVSLAQWQEAQSLDNAFISDYGKEFPITEDPADTMVAYFAARQYPERFHPIIPALIESMIPNRLDLLDTIDFDRP
jgi:hypothetical protein